MGAENSCQLSVVRGPLRKKKKVEGTLRFWIADIGLRM